VGTAGFDASESAIVNWNQIARPQPVLIRPLLRL